MLNYFSIVENESIGRMKFKLMHKMIQPCGPPPEQEDDDDLEDNDVDAAQLNVDEGQLQQHARRNFE